MQAPRSVTILRRLLDLVLTGAVLALIVHVVSANASAGLGFRSDALFGHVVKRGYLGSALRFGGEVVDSGGRPADGVSVVVLAGDLDGSGMTAVASTSTARRGRFGVWAPRGGSRVLVVQAGGTVIEEVRELVGPTVWVRVSSAPGARLVFHGRLFEPGANPTVLLQSRTPRGWQTFAGLTPNPANHGFAYVYRSSRATVGYRYGFRAVTLPADPWISGASHVHSAESVHRSKREVHMVSFLHHVTFTLAAAGGGGGGDRGVHPIQALTMWLVAVGAGIAVIGVVVGTASHIGSARARS